MYLEVYSNEKTFCLKDVLNVALIFTIQGLEIDL